MIYEEKTIETIPVGPLGLVPLKSCMELGKKVNINPPLHLQGISGTPILSVQRPLDLAQGKQREP